jgi:hypothetical protein
MFRDLKKYAFLGGVDCKTKAWLLHEVCMSIAFNTMAVINEFLKLDVWNLVW